MVLSTLVVIVSFSTNAQVSPHDIDTIFYVDCAKLGVLQQGMVNALGEMAGAKRLRPQKETTSKV